jgi:chromosome partitioning protein
MIGQPKGKLAELVAPIPGDRFGDRLFLLPACNDAFLLDAQLATVRGRERTLEKALSPLESDYDVIIVDCPPSLGMAVDAALYYSGTREAEKERNSGIIIPVQAEDSSAEAYVLLSEQIEAIKEDLRIDVDTLGLVVTLYSPQRGHIATSSLEQWQSLGTPPVLGIMKDLKQQREAVRLKQPILDYDPDCELANVARSIARRIS